MDTNIVEFSKSVINEFEREEYSDGLEGIDRWVLRCNGGIKIIDIKSPCTAESLAEVFDKLAVSLREL